MITTMLMAALLAAAPSTDPEAGRKTFTACLHKAVDENLEKKTEPSAFTTIAAEACKAQSDDWKTAYVAADKTYGIKAAESEANFKQDYTDVFDNITSAYKDYFDSGSRPVRK